MFKKLLVISGLCLGGLSSAMAGFYVGPMVTFESISAGDMDYQGFSPRLLVGYSSFLNNTIYIAGEVQGSGFTILHNNNPNDFGSLKTTWSYGASILPGMYVDQVVLAYARVGFLKTNFSNLNQSPYGFELGGGIEFTIVDSWAVRGEVDRVEYSYLTGVGHPYAYVYGLGITHRFS